MFTRWADCDQHSTSGWLLWAKQMWNKMSRLLRVIERCWKTGRQPLSKIPRGWTKIKVQGNGSIHPQIGAIVGEQPYSSILLRSSRSFCTIFGEADRCWQHKSFNVGTLKIDITFRHFTHIFCRKNYDFSMWFNYRLGMQKRLKDAKDGNSLGFKYSKYSVTNSSRYSVSQTLRIYFLKNCNSNCDRWTKLAGLKFYEYFPISSCDLPITTIVGGPSLFTTLFMCDFMTRLRHYWEARLGQYILCDAKWIIHNSTWKFMKIHFELRFWPGWKGISRIPRAAAIIPYLVRTVDAIF